MKKTILFVSVVLLVGVCDAFAEPTTPEKVILLKKRTFIPEAVGDLSTSKIFGHVIIQFENVPDEEMLDTLYSRGIDILEWIPRNAVMAYLPSNTNIGTVPGIRWVGKLQSSDKVSRYLQNIQYF